MCWYICWCQHSLQPAHYSRRTIIVASCVKPPRRKITMMGRHRTIATTLTGFFIASNTVLRSTPSFMVVCAFTPLPLLPRPLSRASIATALWSRSKTTQTGTSRQNRIAALQEWTNTVQVAVSSKLVLKSSDVAGLGWFAGATASTQLESGSVVLTVPSNVALTVECPGSGPDDSTVTDAVNVPNLTDFPWYVQMAAYLHKLDKIDATKRGVNNNYRPWLDSLPRQFDTPLHWSTSTAKDLLQYDYLVAAVEQQREQWTRYHDNLKGDSLSAGAAAATCMSWDDYVWGCECARSRAFSGTYTGSDFNPSIYAFTLLLVTVYVALNLGTLEQAANGAGIVFAVSILKDFVFPRLFKKRRYVLCPMIDMANHKSIGTTGIVSYEYFSSAYSLAIASSQTVASSEQLYISYGSRSNDQLLQYYGFVEVDNPHDVYVMPPLRAWDISALEQACGRQFATGRLQKLDRAGLLGSHTAEWADDGNEETSAANVSGGVVLSRALGIDPAILQALRALVSTDAEWDAAGQAIGNFAEETGAENERCTRLAARTAIEMELTSKATTIQQDEDLMQRMNTMRSLDSAPEEVLAVQFRLEKKKLLREIIDKLT